MKRRVITVLLDFSSNNASKAVKEAQHGSVFGANVIREYFGARPVRKLRLRVPKILT